MTRTDERLLPPQRAILPLSLAALLFNGWIFRFLPVDDAFITYRYAVHLARGAGLVYNIGERVEGYTNFLWVILLAAGTRLGADPVRLGTLLGGIASGLTVIATWYLGRALLRRDGPSGLVGEDAGGPGDERRGGSGGDGPGIQRPRPRITPALPAFFLAISPALGVYGFCGLETPLFTFWIVAAACVALGKAPAVRDDLLLSSLLVLATLTRPEGALVFAVVLLTAPGPGGVRERIVRALRRAAFYAAPVTVYLAWKVAYYGTLVPNTAYAKLEPGARSLIVGFQYVLNSYFEHGLLACGLLLALSLFGSARPAGMRMNHALLIVYSLYVIGVGGDFFPFGRFILPVLPFYYVAVADGLERAFDWLRQRPHGLAGVVLRLGVTGWALLLSAAIMSAGVAWRGYIVEAETNPVVRYILAGKWLAAHAAPDEVIASGAAGAIAYYSNLTCIDMLGLTDPNVARQGRDGRGAFTPGHSRAAPAYVLSRRPDYVFVPNVYYAARPLTVRTAFAYTPMHGEAELMAMPEFRANYRIENVQVEGKYLGFWRLIGGGAGAR